MGWLPIVGWWINLNIYTRNSAAPASDYDGRVVKAVSPVKTLVGRNHWAGDTSLVGMSRNLLLNLFVLRGVPVKLSS